MSTSVTEQVVTEEVTTDETVEIKDPKAVLAALDRAKADAKSFREQYEAATAELESLRGEMQTLVSTQEEQSKALNENLLDLHIERELIRRGLSSQGERVRKYLSKEGISIGEDKKPVGLEEAFSTLEKDFPEIFDPKKRVGGGADQFNKPEPTVKRSGTEAQVAHIFNKE